MIKRNLEMQFVWIFEYVQVTPMLLYRAVLRDIFLFAHLKGEKCRCVFTHTVKHINVFRFRVKFFSGITCVWPGRTTKRFFSDDETEKRLKYM